MRGVAVAALTLPWLCVVVPSALARQDTRSSPAEGTPPLASDAAAAEDPEYRAALDLVYDGAFAASESRLASLAREHPRDPVAPYLQALALEWRLEQDPQSRAHDLEVEALADQALALAEVRLAHDPRDGRALLARGAAHGIKSRLHLFRWDKGPAAREAVRMREALLAARASGVKALDLDFGLGLYDYYAATLPRIFKVVAFVLGIPGGDRQRGLEAIARVARGGSLFHDNEARVQMYDIHSYFEKKPDRALYWIRELRRRYPGWPLWGLKLAELLRQPLGLAAESASVCREILDTAERHRHPNYQPVVAEMARVLLAEALLLDLQLAEARALAAHAAAATEVPAWVRARAELALARSLELEGDGPAAVPHYRAAAAAGDPAAAHLALAALEAPASEAAVQATRLLSASHRFAERGEPREAERLCQEAFDVLPASDEASLCAARASLAEGHPARALALAQPLLTGGRPWLRPQARLVLGAALESQGDPEAAIAQYRSAWEEPFGRASLRAQAAAALRRLQPQRALPETPPLER